MTSEVVALLAAVTALCAVMLAPLVSPWTEKQRTRVAVLSANRQAWINRLRDDIAEFVSIVSYIGATHKSEDLQRTHAEKYERLLFVHAKIKLMSTQRSPTTKRFSTLFKV